PGGFPGDPRNAFSREGRTAQEEAVFAHLQKLARLRSKLIALRQGKQIDLYVSDQQYCYARVAGRQQAIIVINNDIVPAAFEFGVAPALIKDGATLCDQLGTAKDVTVTGTSVSVEIPARSAAIYSLK